MDDRTKIMSIARQLPVDAQVYLLPEFGLRATHRPATPMHVEAALVEIDQGRCLRSLRYGGRWHQRHEIAETLSGTKTTFRNVGA